MVWEIKISSSLKTQSIDITHNLNNLIKEKDIKDGVICIFVPHTTAGIVINEHADPSVQEDILSHLKKLVPRSSEYKHLEGNADAHIKASIVNTSTLVLVSTGKLLLGTWQGILFLEFDGPRSRKIWVKVL